MFRPWIRVARPDDWTGALARGAMWALLAMLMVPVLLARLPPSWIALAGGFTEIVRLVLVLLVLYLHAWVRAVVYSRLPAAPYIVGRRLVIRERGKRVRVDIRRVADVHVELRPAPARETFVIELEDGSQHDVCPVHWDGAPRLYAALSGLAAKRG